MTLVRYNPLSNFVPSTFGDLLESALRDTNTNTFTPNVDITRSEKEMQLHIVAPGLKKEDFKIDLDENRLTISGERKLEEKEGTSYIKRESHFGKFSRTFNLTEEINKEKIDASYADGILKVTLPLIEKKINKAVIKVK